jgi:anaerobic selenocysteine-containing dehydrogenase
MTLAPGESLAHRICPFCEACCGLELKVAQGKVVSIRGHEADVFSHGYMCPKGTALKDLHEDPDRLRVPLIMRDGRFVEASWEEAYAEIARRLGPLIEKHGRDSVAMVIGNPVAHKIALLLYFPRLAKALGSRNLFSASTLDQMPKQLSSGLMFGHWLSVPVPDMERSDYLLVIGANPMVSNGSMWTVPDFRGKAKALRARGGRMVVIDPRRNETAQAADEHCFIRPGGDVFFLLGLVHTLFAEGRVGLKHLEAHVRGVEELRAAVAEFAPEKVQGRCGIAAGDIRRIARELAQARRAAVYGRLGTCTQEYGTLANWLMDALNVLTGNLDAEGGVMFPKAAAFAANTLGKPGVGRGVTTGRRKSRVSGAPEVFGELPITCLAEEIETPGEGQVRALISLAGNPVLSSPNGARLSTALESLEFMVSLDIYLNETTRHADVILPGVSPLQEMHYDLAFPQLSYRNHARYSAAVLEKPAGQPAEWESLLRLAAIVEGAGKGGGGSGNGDGNGNAGAGADVAALDDALVAEQVKGFGEHAAAVLKELSPWRGPERLLDLALRTGPYGDQFGRQPEGLSLRKVMAAPDGIDLGALQPRIPEVLRTPSGQVELAPPMLLEDLRRVAADLEREAPAFSIIGRRQVRSGNSWMHNLPVLAKGPFRCTAMIHPADAQRLGLADGARAHIESAFGAVQAQVEWSDDMMPGVISLPHGWGHDLPGVKMGVAAERPGVNLNALFGTQARDPLSGNAVLSGVAVRVRAA